MLWLKSAALVVLAFLAPIHTLLVAAIVLTLIDAVTGVLAARKRGERIRSAGLRRTISKLVVYNAAIVAGLAIEIMMSGALPVSKLVAGCIAVVEGKSVLENADTISGAPVFGAVIAKLGSKNDSAANQKGQ
jgi:phage-related holin